MPLISSRGNHRDSLKWRGYRVRGLKLTFGNSNFSGHPGNVGHVAADKSLAFIMTCRREEAKRGG